MAEGMLTSSESQQTFTFFVGRESGGPNLSSLLNQTADSAQQVTAEELEAYFNAEENDQLRNAFGSFENYLAYMTEREQLIQSGEYDAGNWGAAEDATLTDDQRMLLEGEDLTVDPSDTQQNLEALERRQIQSRNNAYRNWENSEANQALLEKYGVSTQVITENGTTYRWNGSAYVKTYKDPSEDPKRAFIAAVTAAVGGGLGAGEAVSTQLGLSGVAGSAVTGAVDSIVQQVLTGAATGNVSLDLESILRAAVEQGLISTGTFRDIVDNIPLDTGIEGLNEAITAGILNAGSQLITSGEINPEELLRRMAAAGLGDYIDELRDLLPSGGFLDDLANRTGEAWDDLKKFLEENEIVQDAYDIANSIVSSIGGAIPTDMDELKQFLKDMFTGMSPIGECPEGRPQNGGQTGGWTGTSSRQVGDENVVVVGAGGPQAGSQSAQDVYPGWMDCVNLSFLLNIPGLNIPLPPGMTDISLADIRAAIVDAGESFEDFLGDPSAWFEEKYEQIKAAITDPFTDADDLRNWLATVVGGSLAGVLYNGVKDRLEEEVEDLFLPFAPEEEGNECEIEVDGEMVKGQVKGGKCVVPGTDDDDDDDPLGGATPEQCEQQGREHIPADEATGKPAECGGCAAGFEPTQDGNDEVTCQPIDDTRPECGKNQIRNELSGECEDQLTFTPGAPCKDENNQDGVTQEDGSCRVPPPVNTCNDPNSTANPEGGCGECNEGFERKPGATLCTPIDTKNGCPDGQEMVNGECAPKCPQGSTRGADGKCVPSGTVTEPAPNPCDDLDYKRANPTECGGFNGCPAGQDMVNGECVPACKEGEQRQQGVCVPITSGTTPEPEPEPESGSGGGGGGGAGGMLDLNMGVAYQPGVFTGVEYRAPTQPIRALTALNNMIEQDVRKGLFSL